MTNQLFVISLNLDRIDYFANLDLLIIFCLFVLRMSTAFVLNALIPIIGSIAGEELFLRNFLPRLYEGKSNQVSFLSKAYAGVIFVNCIGSGLMIVILGFKVASARAKYIIEATKEGDKDAEARFSYPKMYAEGFSNSAKMFNCVQRAHQQALETYPQFVVWSLLGGLRFPISSVAGGLLWLFARWKVYIYNYIYVYSYYTMY